MSLVFSAPAGARIVRFGVQQVTLDWTPPATGIVVAYAVIVSRNGGLDEVAKVVVEPEITLEGSVSDVLVVSVIAIGRQEPGGPLIASPRSPPSEPIHFFPGLTGDGFGYLALHCAGCETLQVRSMSNGFDPLTLPALPDPWWPVGVATVSTPNSLDTLWRHGTTGELRLLAFGAPTLTPLAASREDLRDFDVLGFAEIDGDGTREILLRHRDGTRVEFWKAAHGSIFRAGQIPAAPTVELVAAADFDGDGISDLWWQGLPGRLDIWKVELSRIVGWLASIETPAAGLVVEVADFDGDGAADALWRDADGRLTITYLNPPGTTPQLAETIELTQVPDALEVLAVADVDAQAGEEILLQDRDSYRVYMIAPSRQDLPPLVVMFDVREPFDLVHAQ